MSFSTVFSFKKLLQFEVEYTCLETTEELWYLPPLKLIQDKEENNTINKRYPSRVVYLSTVIFCTVPLQMLPKYGS